MSKNFNETVKNARRYYNATGHNYSAEMLDGTGFMAQIAAPDRTYFILTRIDDDAELVNIEISPSIYCPKEARTQVGEYINKINAKYKCCNLRIETNGNLYIHAEQRFDDAPLSAEMFKIMEAAGIKILDAFSIPLDKLAHMKLLEPEEADIEKVIEMQHEKIKKMLTEDLSDRFSSDDCDDCDDLDDIDALADCDDDDFPDIPIHEPSGFSDWLRKRAANGDRFAEKLLADREGKASTETPCEVEPGSLLDELLSIPDDEDGENAEETVNDVDKEDAGGC